jgi:GTP-binding protein
MFKQFALKYRQTYSKYKFFSTKYYTINNRKDDIFTISLIGRTNVGKSTLFNRLLGQRHSLVDNSPGLTRDRKEEYLNLFGVKLRLVDTAGIDDFEEKESYDQIVNKTINQTRQALIYSDLALFIVDSRAGLTHLDKKLAQWLNALKNPHDENNKKLSFYENLIKLKEKENIQAPAKVILVANKCEDDFVPSEIFSEYSELNLGEPLFISAEHGDNLVKF